MSQVCLFAFDLIYLNGESLLKKPFQERRDALYASFTPAKGQFVFATKKDCEDVEQIQAFLDQSIKDKCEGLMVKTLTGLVLVDCAWRFTDQRWKGVACDSGVGLLLA